MPGSELDRSALGYLHVNCGPCHDARAAKPALQLRLTLNVDMLRSVRETPAFTTTVGIASEAPRRLEGADATAIVVAGDARASLLYLRMLRRAPDEGGMPSVGSELVDPTGSALVAAWIDSLAP